MMAARDYHNIAVKADGSVWMWGANDQGQCGNGTTNSTWRPTPVVGLGPRVPLPVNLAPAMPGFASLSWGCATGQFFNVEFSTNCAGGFTVIQSNLLATPPTNVVAVPVAGGPGFYRLRSEPFVLFRFFHHEHRERQVGGDQFQAELVVQGPVHGRDIGRLQIRLRPVELQVVSADNPVASTTGVPDAHSKTEARWLNGLTCPW